MMKYLYRLYQLFICLPLLLVATIITALVTIVGCHLGNGHFWGYYPGKCWGWLWIKLLLLPIKVEGREHLDPHQSYVFVANHQGAFDIFLIYGFLGRNFKWMMKKGLRRIPLVGVLSWCLYVGRRTAITRRSHHHQWQFRCEAAYTRLLLGVLASAETNHSPADSSRRTRR